MRIGIIGAGHAGVEAARQIRAGGGQVVLFSAESILPYYRPRVVLLAFGRVGLDEITMRPELWYTEHDIDLRLDCPVTRMDARARAVTARDQTETFDALIIATGAAPVRLPFAVRFPEDIFPIWAAHNSLAIQRRLDGAKRLVIVGGGISGLEAAAYARDAGLEVTVVEKAPYVMCQQLGPTAAGHLAARLRSYGICVKTGRFVTGVSKHGRQLEMILDDDDTLICDLALTTVGATCDPALFDAAGLETDKGVIVDACQRTSVPNVFACGDVARQDGVRTASTVRALAQGRGAAANAIAALTGKPLQEVPERIVSLSFKHANVEFHAVGPPPGKVLQEKVLSGGQPGSYRSVVLENGILRGAAMIGDRTGFRELAETLGQPWEAA